MRSKTDKQMEIFVRTKTDRQTNRQTDRQTDRQTGVDNCENYDK